MARGPDDDLEIDGLTDTQRISDSGGFAIVYRAFQPRFDRLVAVKVLRGPVDQAAQSAFERECVAIGRLSGRPNILTVYDSGITPSGKPYLIMAYLARGSLKTRLKAGPLEWSVGVDIGVKLARALERAHAVHVLHRDVKPDNVLMSDEGEPQLADFGIARLFDASRPSQSLRAFTPLYAAPEVVLGRPLAPAVDVYSLAATMFTLIAGRPAFESEEDASGVAVLFSVVNDPVPDLLRPLGVPEAVCRAIERGMEKDPADRPASAAEFAADLKAALLSRSPDPSSPSRACGPSWPTPRSRCASCTRRSVCSGSDLPTASVPTRTSPGEGPPAPCLGTSKTEWPRSTQPMSTCAGKSRS